MEGREPWLIWAHLPPTLLGPICPHPAWSLKRPSARQASRMGGGSCQGPLPPAHPALWKQEATLPVSAMVEGEATLVCIPCLLGTVQERAAVMWRPCWDRRPVMALGIHSMVPASLLELHTSRTHPWGLRVLDWLTLLPSSQNPGSDDLGRALRCCLWVLHLSLGRARECCGHRQ